MEERSRFKTKVKCQFHCEEKSTDNKQSMANLVKFFVLLAEWDLEEKQKAKKNLDTY